MTVVLPKDYENLSAIESLSIPWISEDKALLEEIRALLARHDAADEETDAAVDVLIPTFFNFPSVAMILLLSFVL